MQEVSYNLNMKDNLASLSSPQDNRSPSTNCSEQSQENQIDVFEEMMRRERERKEMSKVMAGTHGLHDLGKEISGIAQQREFSSTDYELLLQLDEHESTQKQKEIYQGLDEDTINSLKYWKVHKKRKNEPNAEKSEVSNHEHEMKEITCTICLAKIKEGQMARELPCSHVFHKNCVDKWLKTNSRCPLDNKSVKDFLK